MSRLSPINKIGLTGRWERIPYTSVPNNVDLKKHQMHGEGTVWLPKEGVWYDFKSQFYFDPKRGLWYNPRSGLWNQPGEPDWFELKRDGSVPGFDERDPVEETVYVDEEGNFENEEGRLIYVNPYGFYQHFEGNALEKYRFEFRHHAVSPTNDKQEEHDVEYIYCYKEEGTGEVQYFTATGLLVEPLGSGKYKYVLQNEEVQRPVIIRNEIPDIILNPPKEKGFFDVTDDEAEGSQADSQAERRKEEAAEKKKAEAEAAAAAASAAAPSSPEGATSPASSTAKQELKEKKAAEKAKKAAADRRKAPDRSYSPEAYAEQAAHKEKLRKQHLDTLKTPKFGGSRPVGRHLPDTLEDIIEHMKRGDLMKFANDDEVSALLRNANLPPTHYPFKRPPAQKPILVYDHNRPQQGDPRQSRPPCMNFYAGTCKRGDFCYWRHDEEPKRKGKPAAENKVFFDTLDCPKRHGVTLLKMFPRKGYVCDVCEKEIPMYSNVYQCRMNRCKFDCCPRCANGAKQINCIAVRDMSDETPDNPTPAPSEVICEEVYDEDEFSSRRGRSRGSQ
ncbi:unnamed protein product [Amoebophrya sp. A120]|nr:unnamed protein product [Amoebophrya sp. A120]|eukprot:GSA120T00005424001.1